MRPLRAVLIVGLLASTAPVMAQGTNPFRKVMGDCERTTDPTQRLACYDQAAARLRAMPDSQAFGGSADPVDSEQHRRSIFGLFGRDREKVERRDNPNAPPPLTELAGKILARAQTAPGTWLVVIEDGGTWETETQMGFQPPSIGDTVKIRRSAMGGYLMDAGGQPSIRVNRLN